MNKIVCVSELYVTCNYVTFAEERQQVANVVCNNVKCSVLLHCTPITLLDSRWTVLKIG